ncbi:MAG TPA: DNA polymerase III subunit delta [Rudaea sp.]|nr:DNA polymerase III subunit delta [Rudaea sp.]
MPTALGALRKQLAGDTLAPAYLIAGEEHLLVLEAADAVRARARALGYAEREVLDAEAGFDWNALAQSASAMSLFASRKLIDLRLPSGKPGREGSAAIVEYCERPPADNVLLVTCTQWSKQHEGAWAAAIERIGVFVPVWPLKPAELPAWIGERMAERGLKADRAAIAALAERVEGNSLAAAQEIDKLVLLHGGGAPLDADTLEALVADSARYDVFKLVDASLGGDGVRAARILAGLRAEGEQVPALLGWLLNQLQTMARLAAAGNLAAAFRAERIWPAREALYRKALGRADRAHWDACLVQAARIDRIAKGRGAGDAWRELERLLVAVAGTRASGAANLIAVGP